MSDSILVHRLKQHEGLRLKAYQDTVGVWTIGYGTNLQELTIDDATAEKWLLKDIETATREASGLRFFGELSAVRQRVVIEMVYNLGLGRFLQFRKTVAAIERKDWEAAAKEMLDSRWAQQVGRRARLLAEIMRTGVDPK
jgi:lysozyme